MKQSSGKKKVYKVAVETHKLSVYICVNVCVPLCVYCVSDRGCSIVQVCAPVSVLCECV